MSDFRPVVEILAEVVRRVTAINWLNPATSAAETAFAAVKPFVGTDLNKALATLLITQTRGAYVVFDGSSWENERSGEEIRLRRTSRLWVVVSDRVVGDYVTALYGTTLLGQGVRNPNAAPTPGALGLADLLIRPLVGQLLPNPQGVRLFIEREDPAVVEVDQDKMPGRAAVAVEFLAQGGWITVESADSGPTV